MADSVLELAREKFLGGSLDWDTPGGNGWKVALLDYGTPSTAIKAVTAATNATPIVVTATSHGFANGDIVVIDATDGLSSIGNNAAKGVWKIANQAANTFELTDPITGTNVVGSGAFSGTAVAINLGPSTVSDFWNDWSASLVGAFSPALTSLTTTQGVADAADPTFTAVTGNSVEAYAIVRDTGTASTSEVVYFNDGKQIVTCAATLTAGTTLPVERLRGGIPNGTVLVFSTGQSATLSALANAGDRTLTVTSTTVTVGARAQAPETAAGIPVTPNGGNISVAFDNGANKIFKL